MITQRTFVLPISLFRQCLTLSHGKRSMKFLHSRPLLLIRLLNDVSGNSRTITIAIEVVHIFPKEKENEG